MKPANMHHTSSARRGRALILLGTLMAALITIGCSSNSKPAAKPSQPADASFRPAKFDTTPAAVMAAAPVAKPAAVKPPASKLITYRSRDYGVSFVYPWQYAYVSAKAVARGESSLRPKSDGHEGQFTLARIEIPAGYYPDTNFQSGYFALSLNQELTEEECQAALAVGPNGKAETDTINGVEFRWTESDSGGHGSAEKLRNYVAFANDTCYEVELGVRTENENGLAREVDPDQVLRRLDAILKTVKILPAVQEPSKQEAAKAAETTPQN